MVNLPRLFPAVVNFPAYSLDFYFKKYFFMETHAQNSNEEFPRFFLSRLFCLGETERGKDGKKENEKRKKQDMIINIVKLTY